MARSTCVYVVMDMDSTPVAGFTVKHELIEWLERHPDVTADDFTVWRCGDGLSQNAPRCMRAVELTA
jgi:hypothetical protein